MQFIKFGIIGLSNTIIGYFIYAVTLYLLRLVKLFYSIDVYIAQFIMFVLSVAWSFYWNNRFVFGGSEKKTRNLFMMLAKTYASYAFTSLFLSEVLLMIWVDIIGINAYIAPIINLLITVPMNFFMQKYWVFKKCGKDELL